VLVIYKSSGGRRHDTSHLLQNRAYCLRIRRECALNRCPLIPYNRRYGPQQNGGAVGRAGHIRARGGAGMTYHISTKIAPIAFALGASVPIIGAN
jgi:hypothetical protein